MIKRMFDLLHKDISGLQEAAYVLAFSAFLSQILALLRDRIMAHTFGASESLDIYYASFRIPDFIFITVASIVSISVLVPYLSQITDKDKTKKFLDEIFSIFFVLIAAISIIMFFLVPKLTPLIFRGFSVDAIEQVIILSRIMLLSPILLGLSNFFTGIIQVQKKFFVYALSPLLYNIGIIIGVILLYPIWGMKGLAFGVILGALFHLTIQLPSIIRLKLLPTFTVVTNFSKVKKVIFLSLPRTLALSSGNIAVLFLIALASGMKEGSITIFNFSFALQSIPLSIIGVSYSIAAFSKLSRLSIDQKEKFLEQVNKVTRYIIFWTVSASVLFIVLRAQIVRTVLGSGEFNWTDTRLTAACLAIFALSITAQSLILFFVRAYYSAGMTKRPVMINIFSSVCMIFFAVIFNKLFTSTPVILDWAGTLLKIQGIADTQVIILPLSYSLATLINLSLLYFFIQKDFKYLFTGLKKSLLQILSASLIIGVVTYFSLELWNNVFDINTLFGIFFQGFFSGISGIIVGVIFLKVIGNSEMEETLYLLKKKLSRK